LARIEKKARRGESTSTFWKVLCEIAAYSEDAEVQATARSVCESNQKIFAVGLETLRQPRSIGLAREMWRGLQNALEQGRSSQKKLKISLGRLVALPIDSDRCRQGLFVDQAIEGALETVGKGPLQGR